MSKAVASYGTTIAWEEQQGKVWKPKKHTFRGGVNIGSVLREMRQQSNLRNITLTKE